MQFLEASNTVEILRAAGPEGLHAAEIARRVDEVLGSEGKSVDGSPLDPDKLGEWCSRSVSSRCVLCLRFALG